MGVFSFCGLVLAWGVWVRCVDFMMSFRDLFQWIDMFLFCFGLGLCYCIVWGGGRFGFGRSIMGVAEMGLV